MPTHQLLHTHYPRSLERFLERFDPFITRLDDFGVNMRPLATLVDECLNLYGSLV